ncbi:unnamed protein product [Arabis nemorensis]|uniref:GRF-type domain-containing protein n=1 Tax=Arabis nemorensis TaxID=586526 RepID=A0A565AT37_9BRAS|nr:unnamed protein product [Arabis nemorensis]
MRRTFSYSLSSSSASIRSGCREADGEYGIPASLCYCRGRVVVQTSRTDLNAGRRFFTCKNSEKGGVHVWKWWDDAVMEGFKIVKRLVEYEAKLKELELELLANRGVKEWMLKFVIGGGFIGFAVISTAILRLFT